MNTGGNEKAPAGQPPHQVPFVDQSFPPPPPGPPPNQHAQIPPQHANVTPLQDHSIPPYNPSHPQFAPPLISDEGMYDEYSEEEKPAATKPQAHHGHASKPSWSDRLSTLGTKAAAPLNALANKMGSEGFLPSTMDKEVIKAARILKNFCKDGVYSETTQVPPAGGEHAVEKTTKPQKNRTLLTIPSKVISRAVGLAIFTTGRIGFQVSGATGSGILIARLPDGSWSPPSGIQVHSVGAGFVIGVDIYDCVVVINSREALEAFKQTRMSFGTDLAVVAGPWGAGGSVDIGLPPTDGKGKEKEKVDGSERPIGATDKPTSAAAQPVPSATEPPTFASPPQRKPSPFRQAISKPVYSYVKSRGFYAGVQIDGTVVTERKDANAAFYGVKAPVEEILKGQIAAGGWNAHVKELLNVLKAAEAGKGQDAADLSATTPADASHLSAPPADGYYAPTPGTVPQTGTHGGAGVSTGMQQLHLGGGPLGSHPQNPPAHAAPVQPSKAQEAAAEAVTQQPAYAAPPGYNEPSAGDELPPAYAGSGSTYPADSKTHH